MSMQMISAMGEKKCEQQGRGWAAIALYMMVSIYNDGHYI